MAPIHEAVKNGDLATLKELLVHDRSLVDAPDDHERSPLRLAAQYAQVKAAEILLAAGASTRGVGPNSNTPLHEAAYSGSLPIVERLLHSSARCAPARRLRCRLRLTPPPPPRRAAQTRGMYTGPPLCTLRQSGAMCGAWSG